ncbi:MAG: HAD family hydrolase [Clostridia bacterium]|nr:HAD family hydrolase [Clostridia bacterium]
MTKRNEKPDVEAAALREIPVRIADTGFGLTAAEALDRMSAGLGNTPVEPPGKSVAQIVAGNVFTYFNMLFLLLAVCVFAAGGSWQNAMFMGVIVVNTAIGIVQELRAKKTLDRLTLISVPKGMVIRDGNERKLPVSEFVRDDIVVFSAGNQIFADALVLYGECSVNEALVTGEAEEIKKTVGAELLSGSFVVSGECRARLLRVGAQSYANKLTVEAKKAKASQQSEMMRSLTKLVKWIGVLVIPLGALMAIKEIGWLGREVSDGVVATVASVIGMIPEGLYLLTSMALVAGAVRLSQKRTLVNDMACIETLARVDTLCVDKTGTITESRMSVQGVELLCPDRFVEDDIRMIMTDYVSAMKADNDTMAALRKYFDGEPVNAAVKALPFSSSKKFGGVAFNEELTYLLGAPDVLIGADYEKYEGLINAHSAKGTRVLMLAMYDGELGEGKPTAPMLPLALILLANNIRSEAPETFRYFAKQGVDIKVISGDNALAVSEIAGKAGIKGAENYVDARTLRSEGQIAEAVLKYTVFGRVSPDQKREFVRALKKAGRTVAMTGDGVNDVLALKEADCSIAMASGSDAASQVSHIVLLDSNFASMPSVVAEGRRVINNIERSATLFLVKNIFSFTLAVITLIFTLPYPVTAAQMSLVNALTIGIPGFVLAMEPNTSLVKGRFLPNVLYRALPGGITDLLLILGVILFCVVFGLESGMMSTICTVVLGVVGLLMVHRTSLPYNLLRKTLIVGLSVTFGFCAIFLKNLFTLSSIDFSGMLVLIVFAMLAWPTLNLLTKWEDGIRIGIEARQAARQQKKQRAAG